MTGGIPTYGKPSTEWMMGSALQKIVLAVTWMVIGAAVLAVAATIYIYNSFHFG